MIETLVLFGATGDLAGRFLLPALAALHAAGKLPDGFQVIGTGRDELSDDVFRDAVAEDLLRHAASTPVAAREALLRSLSYRPVDVNDSASVSAVVDLGGGALAAYLALPPAVFPAAVTALAASGLPEGSRIVLEKPFGEDLKGALALNRLLARAARDAGEQAVFRVDHVLGMATVQNLLGLRVAGTVLEQVWNSAHIDQVQILWEETLALEGRAAYYDQAGALKDVLQNHMLQVLSCWRWSHPHGWTSGSCATGRSTSPLDPSRAGGSVAGRERTWSMWFCITSLRAPALSYYPARPSSASVSSQRISTSSM